MIHFIYHFIINISVIDVYRLQEFELIAITTSLPKGQHMLICGVYHPPLHNYQEMSRRSCIIDLADSFLESFPDGLFVCGGDLNQMDITSGKLSHKRRVAPG